MIRSLLLASVALSVAVPAHAQDTPAAPPGAAPAQPASDAAATQPQSGDIVITARRLDEARASIQPSLGATSYGVDSAQIQAMPGGDTQALGKILLQIPGVVQDGAGQIHVRDDHNNLQYRINGTILPEGLAVFGQTLSPRLVDRFNLLTGALPAQYGLRTAGIIDIKTKSGFDNGGTVSIYGGSNGTIQPGFDYGGSTGSTNYFVSGSFRHSDIGIESVEGSRDPLHDKTDQAQAFAYIDHILDDHNRFSLLGGYSNQYFQIPNPRGLTPTSGWSVGGQSNYLSDDLNERQLEKTAFGQLAFLHHDGPLTLQVSLYGRYSALRYRPDVLGELLFNGQAQRAFKQDFTAGLQVDAAYKLGDSNTLRGGIVVSRDRGVSDTTTYVFPVDSLGNQAGQPISIVDSGAKTEWTYSAYLQDEWNITPELTFNFGGRFDRYTGYRSEQQFSPRANLVWEKGGTAIHFGYARYFSPPPFENVATTSIARFVGTSAEAPSLLNTTPFAERQDYFDVGIQQKLGNAITFGIDAYYRRSRNLIDEGQFGAPIVLTPFNYSRGRIQGIEGNASYAAHGWTIYANFAYAIAKGRDIVSSQFSFDPADLAYIRNNYIYLDHDQTYTGSAGIAYAVPDGALRGLKLGADMIYGSGLRTDGLVIPNGDKLPAYAQVNVSASYKIASAGIDLRIDVINVGDHVYEIRDGQGIGVGAPQYGPRRGFFFGITKSI